MVVNVQRVMQGNTKRRHLCARNVRPSHRHPPCRAPAIARLDFKAILFKHARLARSAATSPLLRARAPPVPPAPSPTPSEAPRVLPVPPALARPQTAPYVKRAPTAHRRTPPANATLVPSDSTLTSRRTSAACRARPASTPPRRGPPHALRAARAPTASSAPTARPPAAAAYVSRASRAPRAVSTSAA